MFRRFFFWLAALAVPPRGGRHTRSLAAVLAALLFAAMFVAAGFVIASLTETTRRHAEDDGAYLAGLGAGSWSLLMAIVMPYFGRLFDHGAFGTAYAIARGSTGDRMAGVARAGRTRGDTTGVIGRLRGG